MRQYAFAAIVLLGLIASMGWASEELKLENETDWINYSMGYQIGGDFKRQRVAVNPETLIRGVQDALAGAEPLMSPEEVSATLFELKRRLVEQEREKARQTAQKKKEEGEAFLAENIQKEGMIVQPSGLQYKVLQDGTGKTPKVGDIVTVHYRGTFIDGREFDSSQRRSQPATFQVGAIIEGWTEALQLMKQGAKWELYIPSELAYGEQGMGSRIPPKSTLVFEVELLSVKESQ